MCGIVWIGARAQGKRALCLRMPRPANGAGLRESVKYIRDRLNILLENLPGALSQCAIFSRKMVGPSDYSGYPNNVLLASNRIGDSYKYQDQTPVIQACLCAYIP